MKTNKKLTSENKNTKQTKPSKETTSKLQNDKVITTKKADTELYLSLMESINLQNKKESIKIINESIYTIIYSSKG
jgi:hypothetical protein